MTEVELGRRCGDAIVWLWPHHQVIPDGGTHADLIRALASVPSSHLLAWVPPCMLCAPGPRGEDGVAPAHGQHGHGPACPWALARAWVAEHDGADDGADVSPDAEPPMYDDGPGGEPWQGKAP